MRGDRMTASDCDKLPVVIVSCGTAKRHTPAKAGDLYVGDYFRDAIGYARSITCECNVFIVSAKYGLVKTNQVLRPYNVKMGDPDCITTHKLTQQATALGIIDRAVVVLAGKDYVPILRKVFSEVCVPFDQLPKKNLAFQRQQMRNNRGVNLCAQQ